MFLPQFRRRHDVRPPRRVMPARRPLVEDLEGRQLLSAVSGGWDLKKNTSAVEIKHVPATPDIQGAHIGTSVATPDVQGRHIGTSVATPDDLNPQPLPPGVMLKI